jgi:putative component of membrane protein insertase Oxa1/YidC/SpoIIIJ protein YidD
MLACLLIAAIHGYRAVKRLLPRRGQCLFAVSCSRHVELVARTQGLRAALTAARRRLAACRPGYHFEYQNDGWRLVCRNGAIIGQADAAPGLAAEAALCRLVLAVHQ